MNKSVYWAAGVLLALTLSGCSAASPNSDRVPLVDSGQQPEVSSTQEPVDPPVEDWPYTVREDGEAILLGALRNEGLFGMNDATDEELLAFGYAACEQLAAGVPIDDVDTIPVDYPEENVPGWNDRSMAGLAAETLCTEFNANDNG